MKLYRKLIARFKLLKMQRATGIKLTKKQRKVALNPSYPNIRGWDRQSGKTVAAIFWTLLWWDKPISYNRELSKLICRDGMREKDRKLAIPDPDIRNATTLKFSLLEYIRYAEMCEAKKINVAQKRN